MTELVRINQKIWGSGLSRKSRFKEGTEVKLPRGVSAEAVAAARHGSAVAASDPRREPNSAHHKAVPTYVAAQNETPTR